MRLITARKATPHVTVSEKATVNASAFGKQTGVFGDAEFAKQDNVSVRINKMSGIVQGREFCVLPSEPDTITVSAGVVGKNRITIICLAVRQNFAAGTQEAEWVTVDGTASSSAVKPTIPNQGSLDGGDAVVYFPILRVDLNGTTISSVKLECEWIHLAPKLLVEIPYTDRTSGAKISVPNIDRFHTILVAYMGNGGVSAGYSDGCGMTLAHRNLGATSGRHAMEVVTPASSGTAQLTANRCFTFDDNGLNLEDCTIHRASATAANATVNNGACCPIAVYGIA